jgi:hypothetical protein
MKEADILSLAEALIEEYTNILHVDPYYKIQVEITDLSKISDCVEAEAPATWKLRLNPSQHRDEIDVQMSVVKAVLSILFRDIPPSNKLNEALSKLTHAFVQLTVLNAGEVEELETPAED